MYKVLLESTATVTGSKVTGIALTPTTSANKNNYLPDVIDTAKNVNIPLDNFNWEHTDEKVGTVKFTVDPKTHTMYYEGNILTDRKNQVKEGKYKVSIEAHVDEVVQTCTTKTCYNTPMQLTMEGLAITANPSVPTTTMSVIESVQDLEKLLIKEDDYPWDDCMADQMKRYGDEDTAKKVCGAIKANNESVLPMQNYILKLESQIKKLKEDVDMDGSASNSKVDHKFKPSSSDPNTCEQCGMPKSNHPMNESIDELKAEVTKLRKEFSDLESALKCKTCGGLKKHG